MLSAYRFQIGHVQVDLEGLRSPLRVAWLCDLHFGPFMRAGSVTAWVDSTLALEPDLVLLGGDIVDHLVGPDLNPLTDQLSRLAAPFGVWGVWGNHDVWRLGDELDTFGARLASLGITILVNRGCLVRDDLYLAGVDDLKEGQPDIAAALTERPPNVGTLLLSHNPDILPRVPASVGLTLCGHTHGGQVRLPFIGPVATSSRYGRRFASGWVEAPARGYVSRGLGVTQLPIRLACPPELTVLTLMPASAEPG